MDPTPPTPRATVLDAAGRRLSPTGRERALTLVSEGRADLVTEDPLTIRLRRTVALPSRDRAAAPAPPDYRGAPLLVHTCCGPCATYSVAHLRGLGWHVEGYWANPNIHPFSEHERRREALEGYAARIGLPMHWAESYRLVEFLRALAGHERPGERCARCYRLRLDETAAAAAAGGFRAITTTLLISPYQDQAALRRFGEEVAAAHGVGFFYDNLRRGYADSRRLAREAGLYMQRYCGCLFSEWEARDPVARAARRSSA